MVHSAHGEYCLLFQLRSRSHWSSIFSSSAPSFVHHDRPGKSAPTFPKAGQAAKGSRQPVGRLATSMRLADARRAIFEYSQFPDGARSRSPLTTC